jgi:hypothetical protein
LFQLVLVLGDPGQDPDIQGQLGVPLGHLHIRYLELESCLKFELYFLNFCSYNKQQAHKVCIGQNELGYDFLYRVNTIFSLKPIVKKLVSIEIVIFHICTLGGIIRKISVTGSCLKQT